MITKVDISAPFRSTSHDFRMEMHQCRHCDAVTTTPEQSDAISAKVRETHAQWMANKLKKIQKQLGNISLRDMADCTQISFATLGRISAADHLVEESTENSVFAELEKLVTVQKNALFLQMENRSFIQIVGDCAIISATVSSGRCYDFLLSGAMQSPLPCRKNFSQPVNSQQEDSHTQELASYA